VISFTFNGLKTIIFGVDEYIPVRLSNILSYWIIIESLFDNSFVTIFSNCVT